MNLVESVQHLPTLERRVLTLRKTYGMGAAEIAERLKITQDEVERVLADAYRHLAASLTPVVLFALAIMLQGCTAPVKHERSNCQTQVREAANGMKTFTRQCIETRADGCQRVVSEQYMPPGNTYYTGWECPT